MKFKLTSDKILKTGITLLLLFVVAIMVLSISQSRKTDEGIADSLNSVLPAITVVVFILLITLLFLPRFQSLLQKKVKGEPAKQDSFKTTELSVFERISDAFAALDTNWRFTYVNKKAGEILRRDPGEMIGKHAWTDFPESIDRPFYKACHRAMEEQQYIHMEEYYPPYDRWFENHIYPSPDGLSIFFRDITEKKKMDDELIKSKLIIEESERKFKTITNQATEGIALADDDGNYKFVNPAFCKMTGYSEEELLKMTVFDLTAKTQPHSVFFESKGKKLGLPVEVNLQRKDGSEFMTEIIGTIIKIGGQEFVLGTVRDITERKLAEERIRKSEEQYKDLVENITDLICTHDLNGLVLSMNKAAEKTLGHKFNPSEKMNIKDILSPEFRNEFDRYIAAIQKYGHVQGLMKVQTRSGETRIWEYNNSLKTAGVDIPVVRGYARDITEHKKAETALLENKRQLESAIKASNTGLWDWNLRTNKVYFSPEWKKQIGYEDYEISNDFSEWQKRVHPDDLEAALSAVEKFIKNPWPNFENIFRFRHKDGSYRWILARASLLADKEGNFYRMLGSHIDITDRKRAEEDLTESVEKIKKIVTNVRVGILMQGPGAEILFSNESALTMLGLTQDQLLGKTSFDPDWNVVHEDGTPFPGPDHPVPQAIAKKEAVKDVIMGVYRPRIKDRVWLLVNAIPELDAGGNVREVICTFNDITERKKAEELIRKNQIRFQAMVENIESIISLLDENFKIIYRSPSARRIGGWSDEERDTESTFGLTHPDDAALLKKILEDLLKKPGVLLPVSLRSRHKNGSYISLEGTAINLLRNNDINAIVVNVRDVTKSKKAEQQLIESENRLRTIVETEPECVKILNSKGEVLSMNPAGLAMIEANSEDQVLGHQILELVDPQYRKAFSLLTNRVFRGDSGTLEFEITGLKGGHRWLETHAVPIKNSEGKVISLLGVTRDITQRKKGEEEIKNTTAQLRLLTAHLQSVREEERKRIGREIHDELGQQLTAIKMDVAWIDKKTPDEETAIKSKLKNIITLLDGSNQSVRNILNELRPGILADYDLLDALEWQGRQFTETTGIPIKLTTSGTAIKLPPKIATGIFRIYQESLTNIMRYAQAGKVLASLSINHSNITFSVEDDGKGFDPVSVSSRKSFGILGMKERVLSLNGKFELATSPGKGTKIIISIPYKMK